MSKIVRVNLPSGGWWEIDTNPPWGKFSGLKMTDSDADLLLRLTTSWGFGEPVSKEAILSREMLDLLAVMEVVYRDVLPFFDRLARLRVLASTALSGAGPSSPNTPTSPSG